MNATEKDRISAAVNQLRPDWPTKSIRTALDHPFISDRNRRDVAVALTWVACESDTKTPARVLEHGPWWRAVAIEGTGGRREWPDDAHRCSICSLHQDKCKQLWVGDHDFLPATSKTTTDVSRTVAALRELASTQEETV